MITGIMTRPGCRRLTMIPTGQRVCLEKAPETHFYIQDCPADRVIRHITPRLLAEKGDVRIYDAGEIITGYPVLVSDAPAGEEITVLHGELLNKKGRLTKENTYKQKTVFYTDGTERSMHCRFTWFGFQYFEVKGNAKVTDCVVIHSDVKVSSTFSSSDETLNWLREAYLRTQLDNMHCGIPSDCPHVERRGYTGDGQLTCNAAMIQLDGEKFYRKWIQDIADCQDSITGHVQYTAPYIPSGGGPGGWGCAIVMVPYVFYRNYGDKEILKELYPQMLHYFDYLEAHSEKDLVVSDRAGEWCLGDWCVPTMGFVNNMDAIYIPAPLVNTYFYIKSMEKVLEIGEIIGNHQADEELKEKIRCKKQAIVDQYFDPATGDFAENQQGSNVFAVDLGIGDERTFANILKHYREIRKYDTGIFATDVLTRILFERGESELAISLLTSKEEEYLLFQNEERRHHDSGVLDRASFPVPSDVWRGQPVPLRVCPGNPPEREFRLLRGYRDRTGVYGYHRSGRRLDHDEKRPNLCEIRQDPPGSPGPGKNESPCPSQWKRKSHWGREKWLRIER